MPKFSFVILYVANPPASAAFYADLLGHSPIETSPSFAMIALAEGTMLGLWARSTVQPTVVASPGGSEVAFTVADAAAVDATHLDWVTRGIAIAQAPTTMDFGHTFVATDPDGHRLRVFAPGEA